MSEEAKPKRKAPISYRVPVACEERFEFMRGELELGRSAFTAYCVSMMCTAYFHPVVKGAAAGFVAQMQTEMAGLLAEFQKLKESGEL